MTKINQQLAVNLARLRQLYSASKVSIGISVILALLLAYKQQEIIAPGAVYTWLAAILSISCLRLFNTLAFDRVQATSPTIINTWFWRFRLSLLATGLAWGGGAYLLYPDQDLQHQLFLVFMLAGLSAGSFIAFAADRVSSTIFYITVLTPLSVKLLTSGINISITMGFSLVLYLVYMMFSSRDFHHTLTDNIMLRIQALNREDAIRASEQRYRLLLNHSPVGIFHYDNQLRITYCNDRFAKLLEIPKDTVIGANLPDHAGDEILQPLRQALAGSTSHYDGWYAIQSKPELWIDMICAPARDRSSAIEGGIAIVQDVTESKQAEEMLRVAAIAFETQTAMIVTAANFVILRVNAAFTRLTGYEPDAVIGKVPKMLDSGRHNKGFFADIIDNLKENGNWQGEVWNRRKNGLVDAEWVHISTVTRPDGKITHHVISFSDITENKDAVAEIHRLAYYDPLTHLPNRRLLQDRLGQELTAAGRNGIYGAILFLDLDNFKALNDTQGHTAGDQLLIEVAKRLSKENLNGYIVGRLGGDEFVVLADNLSPEVEEAAVHAQKIAETILVELALPYHFEHFNFHCSASIGIRLFRDQDSVDGLLRHADMAMYHAKATGRNQLCFFDPEMETMVAYRVEMEKDLRTALQQDQFEIRYQSFVNQGKIVGAEALICWQHPERGLVLPNDFIHFAEKTDLILPIGQWVLESVCAQLKHWQGNGLTNKLILAVNVSVRQFRHPNFISLVSSALKSYNIKPGLLKLELTESMLLDNINDTIVKMQKLKEIGVRLVLDDFGTGYSSLSYLTQLPLDELKIDQSFVNNVCSKPEYASIVQTIIGMAHNLNLEVIAEGVETEPQRAFLEQHGCLTYQGYLFSRPVSIAKFEQMLRLETNAI